MNFLSRVASKSGYRLILAALVIALGATAARHDELLYVQIQNKQAEVTHLRFALSLQEAKLAEFFANHGSPAAVEMAQATAKAARPRLMAAVAVTESNGSPGAVGAAGERGAWQVIPRFHGDVPTDAAGQCDQSEKILEDLLKKSGGDVRRAVAAYNGRGAAAAGYSNKVMAMLAEVPR